MASVIRSVACALVGLCALLPATGKQDVAHELWEKARETTWLAPDAIPPFRERIDFVITPPNRPSYPGHYRRDYLDAKHYRDHVRTADYEDVFVQDGEWSWRKDESDSRPARIAIIDAAAPPIQTSNPNDAIHRTSTVLVEGESLTCVAYEESKKSYCFDLRGKLIRTEQFFTTTTYSKFEPFEGKLLSRRYEITMRDGTNISADVRIEVALDLKAESLRSSFKEKLRVVSQPTECKEPKAPIIKIAPDPDFVNGAITGTVLLSMVVDPDGIPRNIRLTRPLASVNDREAMKAAEQWRFFPGTCDGTVHSVPIEVEMTFRPY